MNEKYKDTTIGDVMEFLEENMPLRSEVFKNCNTDTKNDGRKMTDDGTKEIVGKSI